MAYNAPGPSRLPMVDQGGDAHLKQNFMHLRTGGNRSGMHSLDRARGGGRGRANNYLPSTNSSARRSGGNDGLNYNSSSIPYLNKRGDSSLGQPAPVGS
jgi:hypothetical protein